MPMSVSELRELKHCIAAKIDANALSLNTDNIADDESIMLRLKGLVARMYPEEVALFNRLSAHPATKKLLQGHSVSSLKWDVSSPLYHYPRTFTEPWSKSTKDNTSRIKEKTVAMSVGWCRGLPGVTMDFEATGPQRSTIEQEFSAEEMQTLHQLVELAVLKHQVYEFIGSMENVLSSKEPTYGDLKGFWPWVGAILHPESDLGKRFIKARPTQQMEKTPTNQAFSSLVYARCLSGTMCEVAGFAAVHKAAKALPRVM